MKFTLLITSFFYCFSLSAQTSGTLLLEQPDMNQTHITFVYGGDVWVVKVGEQKASRITSTSAVESSPHFSPDGKQIAFTSNRTGDASVYVVNINGGDPTRLTYHPSGSFVRGWANDGSFIYYASSDTRMHVATTTEAQLLDYVINTPPDGVGSYGTTKQRIALIKGNLNK